MKKASLIVTPVVGLPQVSGWSQVTANSHSRISRFVCALSVEGDNAGNIGRTISESIAQFNPGNTEDALHFFENLSDSCEDQGAKFCGSAIFFSEKETAFMSLRGAVILKREGKVGKLIQSSDQLQVLVGRHQLDDVIVLATQSGVAFLPEIEQKFKTGFDTDTIITSIVPGIHSQENSSLISLAFIVRTESDVETAFDPDEKEDDINLSQTIDSNDSDDSDEDVETADVDKISEPLISAQAVKPADSQLLEELGVSGSRATPPPEEQKDSLAKIFLRQFFVLIAKIWRGFLTIIKKIFIFLRSTLFSKDFLSKLKPSELKNIITNSTTPRLSGSVASRKKVLPIAVFSVSLLAIIIILLVLIRSKRATELEEIRAMIEPIRAQVVSASDEVGQNPIESRQKVRQSVQELESILASAKNSKKSKPTIEAIEEALNFATSTEFEISGQLEVNMLNTFYDLRLVSADFVTSTSHSDGKTAVFFDQQKKQLIILNLENKQVRSLEIDLVIESIAVSAEKIYLLAGGIYSLDIADENAAPVEIIAEGDSNRDAKILQNYETYLYVFNDSKRNIYRYARQNNNEGSYSDPIGWMQAVKDLEYSSVTDMAVDGDLWLATQTGELFKLASGRAQDFSVIGLENALAGPIKIATNADQQRIYILESEKRRVVILEKNGTFLKEVVSSSLGATTDIFVSEGLGRAFAVSGSIIYEISL